MSIKSINCGHSHPNWHMHSSIDIAWRGGDQLFSKAFYAASTFHSTSSARLWSAANIWTTANEKTINISRLKLSEILISSAARLWKLHQSGSFRSPERAEMVVSHSPNIPYALAFKPLRILSLPFHLLPPPPPPDLSCWSSSILIENSSPCVLFQFWSCLRLQAETLLWLKLMEIKRSLPHTLISLFSILPPSTSSSVLLGQPEANYPTQNLFIFCGIRGADSPSSCIIPQCDVRKRTGTHVGVGTWRQKDCHLWWQPTVVPD